MIQREKKLRMEISEETKENEGRGQKGGCVEGKKKKKKEKKKKKKKCEEKKKKKGRGKKGGCVEGKKKKKKGSPLMFRRRHIRCCRSESETLEID